MENLGIQTTQNVFIINKIASVGERMIATIIDITIIAVWLFIISETASIFDYNDATIFQIIFMSPVFFYALVSEIFMHGQSLGKKVIGIKVIKIDGSQPTIGNYITRWIFRPLDVYFIYGAVGIITVSANGKGQRLGDILSKTAVISLKKKENIDKTIYVDTPDDYTLFYEDISMLEEADIITVKDILVHYENNTASASRGKLVRKTAEAIASKTGIKINNNPLKFLKQIMSDYNFIHKNSTLSN